MIRFFAKYYDGRTSHPHDVEVHLDDAGTLHIDGLAVPCQHPLETVRIAPRLGNAVRSITLPEGAKLETADNTAVDELGLRTGRRAPGGILHQLESRWRNAIAAVTVLVLVVAGSVRWGIPLLAERLAASVPEGMAHDLGKGTLGMLDRTMLSPSGLSDVRKAELTSAFDAMAANYPRASLRLLFRKAGDANAFALPDGTVVVTDELVALATDDRQILGVLAHEIGHVHRRHALRMALESSTVALLVAAYFGDAAQITTLSASLPAVYAQAHYSRERETEADSFAMEYMAKAGIPLHHFADMLRALKKSSAEKGDEAFQYLSSHPPTTDRILRFDPSGR